MYAGILVWASTPVPVASEPQRGSRCRSSKYRRWHSMLLLENCGLKYAIDIVDSWSVGDVCNTCQDLGFLCRRQCGEGNDDFLRRTMN